ncbi:MAG: 2-hydroxyacyl-CoA dehydratase family protein [Proteobacteria bacterium]|nr:2-hydroxyacyl-CoA dehydratase family protein [Pseudomonadota bacterium]
MDFLDTIKEKASSDGNADLNAFSQRGKKIIGYFCSYFPEEIIHAAGMIPYRMRATGKSDTTKGDIFFSSLNCTFVRRCFDKALNQHFDFLDGIIFLNGCDHTRRLYDNWRHADIKPDFRYMFVAPHKIGRLAEERFSEEMVNLKTAVENAFDLVITDDALRRSIHLYNKKRQLIAALYRERLKESVPIKGSELLSIMLTITMMPVEDAISLLETVIEKIDGRKTHKEGDLRVFMGGGCVEEIAHLELIESVGASIVADNLCLGYRHADMLCDESMDPFLSLARRYLNHFSCPRMMNDFRRRLDFLHTVKKEAAIDAFIFEKLKFCDLWGGEMYLCRQESRKHNYPILLLERELYGGSTGQIRTRIQAFFEQVRNQSYTPSELVVSAGNNYKAVMGGITREEKDHS